MSSTGRVDEGVVTQDDNTIDDGNDSLDASYMTDTDPADLRAQTIEVMRRAGAILEANGRGTREERAANRRRQFEEELNGDLTDEEVEGDPRREGMNAEESLPPAVAEASRGEGVEVEGGGGEEDLLTGGGAMPFDPALNQFLSAAPVKPDVVKNGDWPKSVAPRVKMSAQDKDCVIRANANIAKAVEMGKRINEKACQDHASFTRIIKSGATALNGARRDKAKAEAGLKKKRFGDAAALYKSGGSFNRRSYSSSPSYDRSRGRSHRSSNRSRSPHRRSSGRSRSDHSRRSRSRGRSSGRSRRSRSRGRSSGRSRRSSSRDRRSGRSCRSSSRSPSSSRSGSRGPTRSRRDPKKSTSRDDTTHLRSPPPSLPTQVIPNGILDPTEPARRNEALDHLENSGRSFSNG